VPRIIGIEKLILEGIDQSVFEISNPKVFTLSLLLFINNFIHLDELLLNTELYDEFFKNKKTTFYKYLLEQTFKTLRPTNKQLKIPKLSKEKINKIDYFVKMIYSHIFDIKQ
jgi:hypothetical protein